MNPSDTIVVEAGDTVVIRVQASDDVDYMLVFGPGWMDGESNPEEGWVDTTLQPGLDHIGSSSGLVTAHHDHGAVLGRMTFHVDVIEPDPISNPRVELWGDWVVLPGMVALVGVSWDWNGPEGFWVRAEGAHETMTFEADDRDDWWGEFVVGETYELSLQALASDSAGGPGDPVGPVHHLDPFTVPDPPDQPSEADWALVYDPDTEQVTIEGSPPEGTDTVLVAHGWPYHSEPFHFALDDSCVDGAVTLPLHLANTETFGDETLFVASVAIEVPVTGLPECEDPPPTSGPPTAPPAGPDTPEGPEGDPPGWPTGAGDDSPVGFIHEVRSAASCSRLSSSTNSRTASALSSRRPSLVIETSSSVAGPPPATKAASSPGP